MSELRVGAAIRGTEGHLGHLHQVVLDGALNRVVHLVVVEGIAQRRHAVPAAAITEARYEEIGLDLASLHGLPHVNLGRREEVIAPGSLPELARLNGDADLPLVVAGSGFPVVDRDGDEVGVVDEWWTDDDDLPRLTHAVVERRRGVRLDEWVLVPASHFFLDPKPELQLALTEVDLAALPSEPVLPGVHLRSVDEKIDLSAWTPRDLRPPPHGNPPPSS